MKKKPIDEVITDLLERSSMEAIPRMVDFILEHAREAGFEKGRIADIGAAIEEAFTNIVTFSCPEGEGDIKISCTIHEMGSLIVNIVDTGKPFNMLFFTTFPEVEGEEDKARRPSTAVMKRVLKNIEYRRDANRNILIFTVPR
jgi:anti-sigma regulatory factor (Ser/Thr protein kinase)